MRVLVLVGLLACFTPWVMAETSPYAGEDSRAIKSLSAAEVQGLLAGKGMGFAKVAELNHYPGPRHVLDLAASLELSPQQLSAAEAVFERMRAEAIRLGTELVRYERTLDEQFAGQQISEAQLKDLLMKAGMVRAQLRGVHLKAHLEMKQLLSQHQIMMYDRLRGYAAGKEGHSHSH